MNRLSGTVAIVTGGASGIGRATVARFVEEGAKVVVADIDESKGSDVAGRAGEDAAFHRIDVTRPDDWAAAVAFAERRFGRLDVLVNGAGVGHVGSVEKTTIEDWRRVLAVNLDGVYYGCRAAVPAMRRSGRGSIVNLSSVSGIKGQAELCAYTASKGAVRALSKAVAACLARNGDPIRCNSVHPGVIDTPMVDAIVAGRENVRRVWTEAQPIGRMGRAEEVADMIVLLASDETSFVTGAEYAIDGGQTA